MTYMESLILIASMTQLSYYFTSGNDCPRTEARSARYEVVDHKTL